MRFFSNGVIASGGLFLHLKNNLSLSVGHLKKISPVDSDGIIGYGTNTDPHN